MREAQNARNNRAEIVKALSTGEALFLKACAACHTVGEGDKVGPDLAGVAQRRPRDWLIRFMMEPDVMIAGGDPVAVALDRRYKGVTMPNLSLSETDAADILTYLANREKLLAAQQEKARQANTHAAHVGHHIHTDGSVHEHAPEARRR